MLNRAWNSTECESIADDLASRGEVGCLQEKHKSGTARVQCDTVLVASVGNNIQFTLADDTLLAGIDVVAIKTTGLHQFDGQFLAFFWHRIRRLDIPCDIGTVSSFEEGSSFLTNLGRSSKGLRVGSEEEECSKGDGCDLHLFFLYCLLTHGVR